MKRFTFGSLLVCLLVLASSFLVTTKAHTHAATLPAVRTSATSSPISLQRLKELVHQTLGQDAVNHMRQLITQPLTTHASTPQLLPPGQTKPATQLHSQAYAQEHYYNSSYFAGYTTDAEGVSWVRGVTGDFNVALPTLPSVEVVTAATVASSDGSAEITVGVDQTAQAAYLNFHGWIDWTLFHIGANDKIDSEILWDIHTNRWFVFIEDVTSGQAFGEEFSYFTNITVAGWGTQVFSGGPVPSMYLIGFTNAQWFSNWDGWQPITSSAAASYTQSTLVAPKGGTIMTGEPVNAGTAFALVP